MDTKHLKLIEAIVSEESLTRAAVRLFLTQAALSHQLREIESKYKTKLFHRIKKKLVITDAGRILLAGAKRILPELANIEKELMRHASGDSGNITISTECYTCYFWLPEIIRKFGLQHPHIEVSINTDNVLKPLELLLNGKIDIAIVHRKNDDKNILFTELFTDELVLILPETHRLANKNIIKPYDLNGETFLTHSRKYNQTIVFEKLFLPNEIFFKKVIYIPLTDASIDMVKAGLGIVVLPNWLASAYIKNGGIISKRIERTKLKRQWSAATLKSPENPDSIKGFIKLLKSMKG